LPQGLSISDAVSLAMHSMAVIAAREGISSVRAISGCLGVSEFHLAKVLQRLAKNGLVKSSRGPQGGFTLGRRSDTITLLDVYEAVEGPLKDSACLMQRKTCKKETCILGDSMKAMRSIFKKHLTGTSISDIADIYQQEVGS